MLPGISSPSPLPSADIARAAQVATTARCQNNGRSCIAAKRFIVHTDVYDEFAAAFAANMAELVMGDPMDATTGVGPLATEQGRLDVEAPRCVVLEDSATGVAAGEAAGCLVVAVPFAAPVPEAPGRLIVASLTDLSAVRLEELVG